MMMERNSGSTFCSRVSKALVSRSITSPCNLLVHRRSCINSGFVIINNLNSWRAKLYESKDETRRERW